MVQINAFHPDYIKTYHPDLTQKIIKEQKAKENGQLYGSKAREKESINEPNSLTIKQFPKREKRK
jgi:hypothetical protein